MHIIFLRLKFSVRHRSSVNDYVYCKVLGGISNFCKLTILNCPLSNPYLSIIFLNNLFRKGEDKPFNLNCSMLYMV